MVYIRTAAPDEYRRVEAFYCANNYSQPIDPRDELILAEAEGQICGAVRLVHEEGITILRGMRVSEVWRRKGLGRLILEHVNKTLGNRQCFCIPYRHLRAFYATIGFEEIEPSAAPEFLAARYARYKEHLELDVIIMARAHDGRHPVSSEAGASIRTHEELKRMEADELDFQKIYAAYQPRILRYLARLVGENEAEDLAQEVFVKVSQGIKSYRGEAQLSTWVYRIATNAAIDRIRAASFRQDAKLDWLDDLDETEDTDLWTGEETPPLEQQLMRKEMYECFIDFVKCLPPNYRSVVVLSELEHLPNNEIARILGVSIEVVKIRLHRGRTRLLQELKTHCKAEDWL